MKKWLIYGATGYTGRRIAAEALRRGSSPIVASRSNSQLVELGTELGLETRCFALDDPAKIRDALADVTLVVNAAGPFVYTATALRDACIASGTHYLDISGEMAVLSASLAADTAAREAGVLVVSGAGFDVVPTDCLAGSLASGIDSPSQLSLALVETSKFSKGTAASMLHQIPKGYFSLRQNQLVKIAAGTGCITVDFGFQQQYLMPYPWGDLVTANASTGIENITTYAGCSKMDATLLRLTFPLLHLAYKSSSLLNWRFKLLDNHYQNPTEQELASAKAYVWGRVENDDGEAKEGLFETPEGYAFTQLSVVEASLRVLEGTVEQNSGAMAPAQAFGTGFAESLPGVSRVY
jgi:short subunit dehydrogenase-like uncharacterized protein